MGYIYIYIIFFTFGLLWLSSRLELPEFENTAIQPAKSLPSTSVNFVTVMSLQARRKSSSIATDSSRGATEMAWENSSAKARLSAGGYSFKELVAHWPVTVLPIAAPLGMVLVTWFFTMARQMPGKFKHKRLVGLHEGAPRNPWLRECNSTPGSKSSIWKSGSFHMEAKCGSSGSRGCSMVAEPPTLTKRKKASAEKHRRRLPTSICSNSRRRRCAKPQRSSAVRMTRGPCRSPASHWTVSHETKSRRAGLPKRPQSIPHQFHEAKTCECPVWRCPLSQSQQLCLRRRCEPQCRFHGPPGRNPNSIGNRPNAFGLKRHVAQSDVCQNSEAATNLQEPGTARALSPVDQVFLLRGSVQSQFEGKTSFSDRRGAWCARIVRCLPNVEEHLHERARWPW